MADIIGPQGVVALPPPEDPECLGCPPALRFQPCSSNLLHTKPLKEALQKLTVIMLQTITLNAPTNIIDSEI